MEVYNGNFFQQKLSVLYVLFWVGYSVPYMFFWGPLRVRIQPPGATPESLPALLSG